jgi:hypothetical protein
MRYVVLPTIRAPEFKYRLTSLVLDLLKGARIGAVTMLVIETCNHPQHRQHFWWCHSGVTASIGPLKNEWHRPSHGPTMSKDDSDVDLWHQVFQ